MSPDARVRCRILAAAATCVVAAGAVSMTTAASVAAATRPVEQAGTSRPVAPAGPAVTSASVESRAQQYWERRQAKDLTGAYPFYCSAYRSRVSLAQFLQLTRLVRFDLSEARVADVAVTGDRAQITITYKFMAPTLAGQLLDGRTIETWIRDPDGQWCREDEPLALPFPQSPSPPRP